MTAGVTWALDLDEDGWPTLAHRIVAVEREAELGEVRVTACGLRLTAVNHPRGWWEARPGRRPLSGERAIHCGGGP